MAFDEDLSLFLSSDGFATTGTLKNGDTITGIFDSAYLDSLSVDSSSPVFLCASGDILGLGRGDEIEIDGIMYCVARLEPDGTGMTNIVLEAI